MQTYETDVVAWAKEQARLLRSGRFDLLDIEHIAEEIEDVGKSEQRELANRMALLLAHLLKWQFQPERQTASWQRTIHEQRNGIKRRLKKSPGLPQTPTGKLRFGLMPLHWRQPRPVWPIFQKPVSGQYPMKCCLMAGYPVGKGVTICCGLARPGYLRDRPRFPGYIGRSS
jgi:hypothetical protein